jgi:hypothetical protein
MAILNGMNSDTKDFLTILGQLAGGFNALALCLMAIGLLFVVYRIFTKQEQYRMVKEHKSYDTIKRWAPCIVPLALLMMFTAVKVMRMLISNREFSGAVGLLAFAKAILM